MELKLQVQRSTPFFPGRNLRPPQQKEDAIIFCNWDIWLGGYGGKPPTLGVEDKRFQLSLSEGVGVVCSYIILQ